MFYNNEYFTKTLNADSSLEPKFFSEISLYDGLHLFFQYMGAPRVQILRNDTPGRGYRVIFICIHLLRCL